MANYGKYYIAVRLLLLKQYLEANAGKPSPLGKVAERSEVGRGKNLSHRKRSPLPKGEGLAGKHIFIFDNKNTPKNAKTGSTSCRISGK